MGLENVNIEDLSDDELEAAQRATDGELSTNDPVVNTDPGAAPAAAEPDPAPPTVEAAAVTAGAETPPEIGKPEGVLSKDGSRVLPYAALQAERRSARAASQRAERTERELAEVKQQLEDMRSGKAPAQSDEITEAMVIEAEADFPEYGRSLRKLFERNQELEKAVPQQPASQDTGSEEESVQDAIDAVPLLLEWQSSADPKLFERAQEIDKVLEKSPKWATRSAVERFTEVTRMVADEYDIPFTAPKASPTPAAASAATATAAAAARKPPETLSDFKGGSVADHGSIDPTRASPQLLLNRMQDMSDEEIDAHLAKYG